MVSVEDNVKGPKSQLVQLDMVKGKKHLVVVRMATPPHQSRRSVVCLADRASDWC